MIIGSGVVVTTQNDVPEDLVYNAGRLYRWVQQKYYTFSLADVSRLKHASVCLCDLVVRVPGYRFRGPGSDSRCYQIF
jgi:hypothetical protein